MPYIVTTKREIPTGVTRDFDTGAWECDDVVESVSRCAVTTLKEAKRFCFIALDDFVNDDGEGRTDAWAAVDSAVCALPESGGTVGPLPDGTVIEVKQVTEDHLRGAVAYIFARAYKATLAEVIEVFNREVAPNLECS